MKKFICLILLGVTLFMPHKQNTANLNLFDAINACQTAETHVDGQILKHDINSAEFEQIMAQINNMLVSSHEMPAFAVSLDAETKESMKSGVWLNLIYDKIHTHNDMPFDTLLIEIESEWTGFNIYRGNNGVYEGRCYYINLVDNNMSQLYQLIINLTPNN